MLPRRHSLLLVWQTDVCTPWHPLTNVNRASDRVLLGGHGNHALVLIWLVVVCASWKTSTSAGLASGRVYCLEDVHPCQSGKGGRVLLGGHALTEAHLLWLSSVFLAMIILAKRCEHQDLDTKHASCFPAMSTSFEEWYKLACRYRAKQIALGYINA